MSCLNKSYNKFEGAGAMGSKFRARCFALVIALSALALLTVIVLVVVSGDSSQAPSPGMAYNSTGSVLQEEDLEEIVVTERDSFIDLKTTLPPQISEGGTYSEEEEYVKPIKLGPRSLHDHDILYDQMRNDHEHPQIRHHSGHFRHKQAEVWDPHPQYEIDAFGRKLLLDLTYSNSISPNLHIIHVWDNFTQRVKHDTVACFYSGTVKGDPNSNVFVSLCSGMTGYIKTSDANYWIQPMEPLQDNSSSSILHLIKKSGTKQMENDVNFEQCETETQGHEERRVKRSLDLDHTDYYDDFENEDDPMHYQTYVHSYFIETLVVTDQKMLQYHKTETELINYVLTLMSHVALLFKDASVGNPITLSVVNIMVLRDKQFRGESQEMLRKFCEFQHAHSNNKHDVALLLTRDYLCKNSTTEHCSTLGVAEVGAMCTPSSSCAIVRDKGLSTPYAIGHEFGHVLSMPHDDDNKCTKFQKGIRANNIMSRSFQGDTNPWHWSNCSKHFLTEFLDSPKSRCLLDEPKGNYITKEFPDFPATEVLPGEKFEVNEQCELEFGNGSRVCTFMPFCESLWCTATHDEESGCKTQHNPWGEGTSCGYGRWCHHRKCVRLDRNILSPIAGGWSDWKDWSSCSRTCGGGIMIAKRECKNPAPANGGPYCTGGSVRYMSCNAEPCESNVPDFREQQCAHFNGNPMGIPNLTKDVKWVPKYGAGDKEDYCRLFCRVRKSASYYMLRDKVVDGTKCSVNSFNICVNGVCKKAGCDNRLGSNVTLDECGVCGGDRSTCEKIEGFYNETGPYGYHVVTVIPSGSLHLKVTMVKTSENYLALRDSTTGEYILNGKNTISTYKKEIVYGGLILVYSGSKQAMESVHALHNSRIKKDLIVEVLMGGGAPPQINFTYTIPAKNQSRYKWAYNNTNWAACTSICEGIQNQISVCVDTLRNQETRPSFCPETEESVRTCNTHCKLSWVPSSKGECSTECGSGVRKVLYSCEKRSLHTNEREVVDDKHCQSLDLHDQYESCEGPCNRATWSYSEWSHCSVSCGIGYKSRLYSCYLDKHSIDISYCNANELQDKKDCNMGLCYNIGIQWNTTNWKQCSAECGTGEQIREVFCVSGAKRINENYCENYSLLKPNSTRTCKQNCKLHENYHYPKKNKSANENNFFDYPNSDNNVIFHNSDYRWQSGMWSECSKSCGGGYRRRFVDCIKDSAADYNSHCSTKNKPSDIETCNTHECPKWGVTRWSKCYNCTKQREILCRDHLNNIIDESACNPSGRKRPMSTKSCRKSQCYRNNVTTRFGPQSRTVTYYEKDSNITRLLTWKIGKWSKCCEEDTHKYRPVFCFDKTKEVTFVDALCEQNNLLRPRAKTICKRRMRCPLVYTWKSGEWSECNCDKPNPHQRRSIKCINSRGDQVNHGYCSKKQKPVHKISCSYKCNDYSSCRDVKIRGRTNKNDDYKIILKGKEATIHCFQMDTDNPEEYITLKPNSENYAEIYDKRLNNIKSCPYNGERNDYCDCHIPMDNYGKTEFWKVRLNITSMQIITNIFTFASGKGPNKKISYGTAGDCYSEVYCPQGQFSIDLTGTSFKLSENVKWVASGSRASLDINEDYTKQRITGKCGGSCGYCNPDPSIGLNVELVEMINR